jgi:hypothetical protein
MIARIDERTIDARLGNMSLSLQLGGLTSIKTLDGQAVSGPPALFFIRDLRNYLEGFVF